MFKEKEVKSIIQKQLSDYLTGKSYNQEESSMWTKTIANNIKQALKDLHIPRYKYCVSVIIGEMKGAGARMGFRCLWDASTDRSSQDIFVNDSLFAVAVAWGVYLSQ